MSPSAMRGGAGVLFGILGLLLLRAGPGFAVSASAAPGCKDSPFCYAESEERGSVGPQGHRVDSVTARCVGDCNSGFDGECAARSTPGPGGSQSYFCSCNPLYNPSWCSGIVTVKPDGQVTTWICAGDCGGARCTPQNYCIETSDSCPAAYSLKRRCICE